MAVDISPYSIPVIKKGKPIKLVPVDSTKQKEEAKQTWQVEYYFFNEASGKKERIRVNNGFNRIKNPVEKLNQFEILRQSYKELL